MRAAFAFTAGLALGVAAGWCAAVVLRPAEIPAPANPSTAPRIDPAPKTEPRVERRRDRPAATEPTSAAKPEDRAAILESGDEGAIRRASFQVQPFSEAEAQAASKRLAKARDAGDEAVFLAVLQALGRSKRDALASARIVDVLGDASYPLASLKSGMFGDVERWLQDGDAPVGAGAAARRRIDANAAAGDVRNGADALVRMVARYGDADDLAWLATTTSSRVLGFQAVLALTTVPRAETAPIVAKLVADGKVRGEELVEYARSNPKQAWELVAPIVRSLNTDAALPQGRNASEFLAAYGWSAPADVVDEVRACLVGLRTPELRVAALSAVQALADRKIDVASFQPILDAPIDLLEQGGTIDADRGYACMYGIQSHRVAWSVRSADALESAAPRAGALEKGFRDVAREIRGDVADPWRRK
jgi:hypothetical protein